MQVIINPGAGPVRDANGTQAGTNMVTFARDVAEKLGCPVSEIHVSNLNREERGRYLFLLSRTVDGVRFTSTIEMPGIPVDRVRWMRRPEQDIWDFPRLYVDGGSWVWFFAINCAATRLNGTEGE